MINTMPHILLTKQKSELPVKKHIVLNMAVRMLLTLGMGWGLVGDAKESATVAPLKPRSVQARSTAPNSSPAKAIDGIVSDDSRWVSKESPAPAWLELEFDSVQKLVGVQIYSGYRNSQPIESFVVQFRKDGKWHDIQSAKFKNNLATALSVPFDKEDVATDALRLWITATPNNTARVLEVMVWPASVGELPPLVISPVKAQASWRPPWMDADLKVNVLVSQYGFNPEHPKVVHYKGEADHFLVKRADKGTTVHTGKLTAVESDFGKFMQGDFSNFRTSGDYYIEIGADRSPGSFTIAPNLWDNLQKSSAWYYFGIRRMGEDNIIGNLGDCRLVNWEHGRIRSKEGDQYKYIGRAWADGDDGRIYPSCSLVVAQFCALKESNPFWDKGDWIYSQVRWGLDGALSFLEKDGLLRFMHSAWSDHQHTTYDNRFHSGDERLLGDCFEPGYTGNEYSKTENHEVVYSSLLIGPAYTVCLFRDKDPEFFGRVEQLVKAGYDQIHARYNPYPQKYSLASWVWLNLLMWRMTGEGVYRDRAVAEADRLMELQQKTPAGDSVIKASGWFRKDMNSAKNPWGEKPEQEVMVTPWLYQVFFKLQEYLPEHPKAGEWKRAVSSYAKDYLLTISRLNPFGFTPMKAEASAQSELKRHRGDLGYQYFAKIGRHFHQLGNAAFMLQAGKLMDDKELVDAAWRQLFWFAGDNPSGVALMHGFGKNVFSQQGSMRQALGRAIPSGVNNGATGDGDDNPKHDHYNEYYTYANVNVLWLSTVIGASRFENAIELWPKEIIESPHTAKPDKHPRTSFPVRMKGGFVYTFMAVVRDDHANAVQWLVDGIEGGNAEKGTITAQGVYTAPYVTSETTVTITAVSRKNPSVRDQTAVTLMPVPRKVKNLKCQVVQGKAELSWNAVEGNAVGYTVWRRLPAVSGRSGTIFEMVGSTEIGKTSYTYPNDKIRYYDDNLPLEGMEFMVKAYNMHVDKNFQYGVDKTGWAAWLNTQESSHDKVYGFGPDSDIVKIPERTIAGISMATPSVAISTSVRVPDSTTGRRASLSTVIRKP